MCICGAHCAGCRSREPCPSLAERSSLASPTLAPSLSVLAASRKSMLSACSAALPGVVGRALGGSECRWHAGGLSADSSKDDAVHTDDVTIPAPLFCMHCTTGLSAGCSRLRGRLGKLNRCCTPGRSVLTHESLTCLHPHTANVCNCMCALQVPQPSSLQAASHWPAAVLHPQRNALRWALQHLLPGRHDASARSPDSYDAAALQGQALYISGG